MWRQKLGPTAQGWLGDGLGFVSAAGYSGAQMNPDKARGWLEAYLVRARAPHPDRLPPLLKPR